MELWVIRHASTSWNEEGRYQGRTDLPLSKKGAAEARAWNFHHGRAFDHVFSSSLKRAAETAEALGLDSHIQKTDLLMEMNLGEWEGLTKEEARARLAPSEIAQDWLGLHHRAPGGESMAEVMERLQTWLQEVPPHEGNSLVVSHKGTIQALYALATGWDALSKPKPRPRFPHLHRFSWDGTLKVLALNEPLVRP
ncbi:MAG: histidine phosphatase family protein [Proteobacteria bacterium]|nr:MAG: histidine phosphatase family protein [Pseudomonadota bacterium]